MKYYLTTPIYYVNAAPHIGHFYTTAVADTVRRFKRMEGFDPVVFTTGSDEHGQNVERASKAVGKTPEQFATDVADEWRTMWEKLDIAPDRFIRTSDPKHFETVRDLFDRCQENGYIYKGSYTGQYCFHDELYVNDAQPGDPCPDCGRPTETVTEENYFFKLSAFADRLLELYEKEPKFIQPEYRRNELIAFVKQGLRDLSITRTSIKWGIPVPVEGNHVFYVWFDALTSYMSAVKDEGLWPADLHLIGKDILRFHAIYWPAFLMAAGLPLPKRVFAHGWLLVQESKMSKSRGNVVRPWPIAEVMGTDALRYFLLREITFGQDGAFSFDAVVQRYNSDLANGLGNLASRTLTMIQQYRDGAIPKSDGTGEIAEVARRTVEDALVCFDELNFSRYLELAWTLISAIDKYIVERAPWKLAKQAAPHDQKLLDETLYTAAESLRIVCGLLHPVIPNSTALIWKQLGMPQGLDKLRIPELNWGHLDHGQKIGAIAAVFPRIDEKTAVQKMQELEIVEKARQDVIMGKKPAEPEPEPAGPKAAPVAETIAIEDFAKVDLRVGLVRSAEKVKGADKLLHLHIDIGEPQLRSIVAGIASAYEPSALVGRKVVIVANLAPRKLRGLESQGMIVAASLEGGKPVLAAFIEDVPVGARLK
jgi:methionyl-tRNA synthetase